ncbi:MAG: hypothetical protein H6Q21_391, partial [Bacteroidetes bacterium]|nr:hypothetical protein [Bacteroidota bacterium]
ATNPLSDSDNATFTVTAVNDAPVVTDIPDQTIAEGSSFTTINLDGYVSDVETPDAGIAWTYSGNTSLTVSITSRVATISTPNSNWNGSETITFTATDNDATNPLSDSDNATFTVTAVNDAPVVGNIPNQTIAEGASFATINLNSYVSDAETYATNPLSDSDNATFTVTAVNDAPVVTDIPDQTIVEGSSFTTINLDGYVSDVETPDASIVWTYSGNDGLLVSIVNRVATISAPNDNWNGSRTITFTATDNDATNPLSASDNATFTITNVNDPPVVGNIPNRTIAEGASFPTINLDLYVSDAETSDANIVWTTSGNTDLTVSIVNRVATISVPNADWNGSETITFTATDVDLINPLSDSDDATFTVTAVNDPPVITVPATQTVAEDVNLVFNAAHSNLISIADIESNDQSITLTVTNGTFTLSTLTGLSGSGNGTPILNYSGTLADINAALNSAYLISTENFFGTVTITINTSDGAGGTDSKSISVTVTPVNDPPVMTVPVAQTVDEDVPLIFNAAGSNLISIVDIESNSQSILISVVNGTFTLSALSGLSGSGNGTSALNYTGSLIAINTALNNAHFLGSNNYYGNATVNLTTNDNDGGLDSKSISITITPVNDPPVLASIEQTPLPYIEGSPAVQITNSITVSDSDDATLSIATVAIITGYQNGQDVLSCSPVSGITIVWNPSNGVLTLTGNVAAATFQSALRNVRYMNTSANPITATRKITFLVNDGEANSNFAERNITVGSVNNAPVLGGLETEPLPYTENGAAIDITNNITITDSDDATMVSATVSITANFETAEDVLAFTNTGDITGSWNAASGILTLSGTATIASYRLALTNVSYRNTSENPSVSPRSVTFKVFDGESFSNEISRTITVIGVNDPPVATSVNIVRANNRIGTLHTGTFTYSDPETGGLSPGIHVYKWYRKLPGGSITWIDSVSAVSYTPVLKDGGDSICFEVTPVDNLGLAGTPVRSAFRYINAAPVAGDVHIFAPNLSVGRNITGRFSYSDKENNLAGNHAFQWYRAFSPTGSGTLIASAVDSTYKLSASDDNMYIRFVVTPSATAGSTPGAAVSSAWVGPVGSSAPTAVISGSDTICSDGPQAKITVSLTGSPPWTIRYRRSYSGRTEEITVQDIQSSPYIFDAPGNGTYTLLSVSDINYPSGTGTVSGSAVIGYYPAATAKLTGTSQVCPDGSSSPMSVDFTGTAPWTFIVRRNTQDVTYSDITQDPFVFNVTNQGTYRIIKLYDRFCEGDTVAGFGTAVISYITSPKATLSGIDTICPGDTAVLQVKFEGTGPFSITYLRNGANAKTVSNITQLNYSLKVLGDGTYTLSAVSDKNRSGCASGSGIVTNYTVPTATLSGTATVCEYVSADLRITLTGKAPWSFSYRRNSESPTVVSPVTTSPNHVFVSKAGTYSLVNVSDKYCKGTVSGSAQITVTPAPVVTITGLKPAYSAELNKVPVYGNPAGGTFYPPVIQVGDTNFFFPKWSGPGMHSIVYSYRDPKTGCTGYDTVIVAVLTAKADIIFPENDTKKFFCYNDSSFTIQGRNVANVIGTFSISGGTGIVDNGDNTATITPLELTGNTFVVTYSYFNVTTLEVKESFEIEYVEEIRIVGFDESSYCQNSDEIRLNGNVIGGVFSGNAVFGNQGSGYFFKSELTVPGPDTVFYTYTAPHGCFRQVFKSLDIYDTPLVDFTVEDSCIYSSAADSTTFVDLTASSDPVQKWNWSFDDLESGDENNSTLKNPKHKYSEAGRRDVSLQVTTANNCVSSAIISFYFEEKPSADFTWNTECYQEGKTINLINQSVIGKGEVMESLWKIYTGETYDSLVTNNAEYRFEAPADYPIDLIVSTHYGCRDTITKTLHLRPTYPLAEGASYFEGFESGMAGWISSSDTSGKNSWMLGKPDEPFGSSEEHAKAWYTHITTEWPPEQSYVTSPCFNFSGIFKPMIKFDMRRLFMENRDGAVLQYTADSGKHWIYLGKLDDGINWYNSHDIQGKPGGNVIGWSNIQDKQWIEARHNLDMQKGKYNVQFRFAYGSDGTANGTNGLAFDNVWIGERNKIALIEHFTSSADMASRIADSILDELANSNPLDIIDIQYHTSLSGNDPFNEQNPVDPRTRAALYQLSSVPVAILNGGTTDKYIFDYSDDALDATFVKNQSLMDPWFILELHTTLLKNSIVAVADIRPLKEILGHQVTLHMAVIERMVSGVTGANGDTLFESVLKTLLPDTSYSEDWYPGVTNKTVSRTWDFDDVYNSDEVRIIAFIQDENTREIYQAAIDEYDLHTALEEKISIPDAAGRGFILFPNPASHEVFIGFDEILDKKAKAELYDINGRLVLSCGLFPGNKLYKINLDDCTEGLFIVRITSENQFIGLQKMILSR